MSDKSKLPLTWIYAYKVDRDRSVPEIEGALG
jgi:hypothetical protein